MTVYSLIAQVCLFFHMPCFPGREHHNSLMSSSLLQILAGVFSLIESPLDPKLFCRLGVCVCVCVCVCVREKERVCLFSLAWLGMKQRRRQTERVASRSWNAFREFATLPRSHAATAASSSESGELLISCRGLLAHRWYTCSSWTRAEWGGPEREQRQRSHCTQTRSSPWQLHSKKKKKRERHSVFLWPWQQQRSFLRDSSDFGVNWGPHAGQPVYQIVSSAPRIRDKATSVMRKDGAPETHRGSQRRGLNFIELVLMPAAADIVWFFLFNLTV